MLSFQDPQCRIQRLVTAAIPACIILFITAVFWNQTYDIKTMSINTADGDTNAIATGSDEAQHLSRDDNRLLSRQEKSVPAVLRNLITDVSELKGRHSDFIYPSCQNKSNLPLNKKKNKHTFIGPFPYLKNYKNPCWYSEGSSRLKCIPYFYLIGASKCGTTDVFYRIISHPKIVRGKKKEVNYLDRSRFNTNDEISNFRNYVNFFKDSVKVIENSTDRDGYHDTVIGDGSPSYFRCFFWEVMQGNEGCASPRVTVVSTIHHMWPQAKILMVLRNPVTRTLSTYLYRAQIEGWNTSASQFDQWVKQSIDVWFTCLGRHSVRRCLYDKRVPAESKIPSFSAGIYSRYVLDLLRTFPREQIYFVHLESYTENIKKTLKEVYSFLELPPLGQKDLDEISGTDRRNSGQNYRTVPTMFPSTQKLLEHFFANYNAELSALLDGDRRWLW